MRIPYGVACRLAMAGASLLAMPAPAPAQAIQEAAVPTTPAPYPSGDGTPLGLRIAGLIAAPELAHAHWGIAVTSMDGTPLYGLDEGKLFRPASTVKLFTTAAALALLGPERRFTTQLVGEGKLSGGTLLGDLVLEGGGDANFAGGFRLPYAPANAAKAQVGSKDPLADINDLAEQVAAKGVQVVQGDIVGDDRRFEHTPYPPGWAEEDLLWGYGAPVSALSIHDNLVDLTITATGNTASPLPISVTPDLPYYRINPSVPGDPAAIHGVYVQDFGRDQVSVERAPGSLDTFVAGDVAPRYGPDREELAIEDPPLYAALALRHALERHGIRITGTARTRSYSTGFTGSFLVASQNALPGGKMLIERMLQPGYRVECTAEAASDTVNTPEPLVLAKHLSPPLIEDLVLTVKTSQNLHAEILLRNLAAEDLCAATLRASVQLVRGYWLHAGLSGGDFVFYDGSGLSTKDLVTPRSEAQLLAFAAGQPWFPQWKAALPVGGVDGTLASRFTTPPLKGHIFAKTGTLGESRALAGYLQCASGREVIFAILDDNHAPGSSADRTAMDRIVEAIAAAN